MVDMEALLLSTKERLLNRLNEALGDSPLPTYFIDGRQFRWNEYIDTLMLRIQSLDDALANLPCEEATMYIDPALEI